MSRYADQMPACQVLSRMGWKPYREMCIEGKELEVISYPFPHDDGRQVAIYLRRPNDPETIFEWIFPAEYLAIVLK